MLFQVVINNVANNKVAGQMKMVKRKKANLNIL